ncbi:DgyrCDS12348 [Dimorphilus gyrociliatus]|uniref:DgyrCDS12348 n=1 Tax=Dimorphilus gyrociliatus TaxID=2664684 RepID=A0A7I8W659_9ANNE|nr:DgyrCDS12348 [Dimorphilus gyrociliatus]
MDLDETDSTMAVGSVSDKGTFNEEEDEENELNKMYHYSNGTTLETIYHSQDRLNTKNYENDLKFIRSDFTKSLPELRISDENGESKWQPDSLAKQQAISTPSLTTNKKKMYETYGWPSASDVSKSFDSATYISYAQEILQSTHVSPEYESIRRRYQLMEKAASMEQLLLEKSDDFLEKIDEYDETPESVSLKKLEYRNELEALKKNLKEGHNLLDKKALNGFSLSSPTGRVENLKNIYENGKFTMNEIVKYPSIGIESFLKGRNFDKLALHGTNINEKQTGYDAYVQKVKDRHKKIGQLSREWIHSEEMLVSGPPQTEGYSLSPAPPEVKRTRVPTLEINADSNPLTVEQLRKYGRYHPKNRKADRTEDIPWRTSSPINVQSKVVDNIGIKGSDERNVKSSFIKPSETYDQFENRKTKHDFIDKSSSGINANANLREKSNNYRPRSSRKDSKPQTGAIAAALGKLKEAQLEVEEEFDKLIKKKPNGKNNSEEPPIPSTEPPKVKYIDTELDFEDVYKSNISYSEVESDNQSGEEFKGNKPEQRSKKSPHSAKLNPNSDQSSKHYNGRYRYSPVSGITSEPIHAEDKIGKSYIPTNDDKILIRNRYSEQRSVPGTVSNRLSPRTKEEDSSMNPALKPREGSPDRSQMKHITPMPYKSFTQSTPDLYSSERSPDNQSKTYASIKNLKTQNTSLANRSRTVSPRDRSKDFRCGFVHSEIRRVPTENEMMQQVDMIGKEWKGGIRTAGLTPKVQQPQQTIRVVKENFQYKTFPAKSGNNSVPFKQATKSTYNSDHNIRETVRVAERGTHYDTIDSHLAKNQTTSSIYSSKHDWQNVKPSVTHAKAKYNFLGQNHMELSFKRGDVIRIIQDMNHNWTEGELDGRVGVFPSNYVEKLERPQEPFPIEGEGVAKFNFQPQSSVELGLKKGEVVKLCRRVDINWWEGRNGNRVGIFPCSYVQVIVEPRYPPLSRSSVGSQTPPMHLVDTQGEFYREATGRSTLPATNESYSSSRPNDASDFKLYKSLYRYIPQNADELEMYEGDIVFVYEKCHDGWMIGESLRSRKFGTFPGNYVKPIY